MYLITILLRLGLSAVFGVAGVTKLLDQRGTRDAVKNFGSPESLAPTLALILPIAELAIAAGLLFKSTVVVSDLAALLVLGLFVLVISVNLAGGRTHDCHCFGQLYSRPLGWPTLARNVIFAGGAGVCTLAGTHGNESEYSGHACAAQPISAAVASYYARSCSWHFDLFAAATKAPVRYNCGDASWLAAKLHRAAFRHRRICRRQKLARAVARLRQTLAADLH